MSHPYVERLIGSIRRELLDQTLLWTATDLENDLQDYQCYYNEHRTASGFSSNVKPPSNGGESRLQPCPGRSIAPMPELSVTTSSAKFAGPIWRPATCINPAHKRRSDRSYSKPKLITGLGTVVNRIRNSARRRARYSTVTPKVPLRGARFAKVPRQ